MEFRRVLFRSISQSTTFATFTTVKPPFFLRNYGGKCLDFVPPPQVSGAPGFVNKCNGNSGQQVRIEEVNAQHDVILRAGDKVIGVRTEQVITLDTRLATSQTESPLQLQDEKSPSTADSLPQIFALDGDSIMLASNRNQVVTVRNARGKDGTRLVLGPRNLADAEFWTFTPTDGSGVRPNRQ